MSYLSTKAGKLRNSCDPSVTFTVGEISHAPGGGPRIETVLLRGVADLGQATTQ
jgi:hypothetical protein